MTEIKKEKGRFGVGRPMGSKNKSTVIKEQILSSGDIRDKLASGELQSPISFLLNLMMDENLKINLRLDAAKAAAPYVHAKIATKIDQTIDIKDSDKIFNINLIQPNKDAD